MYYIFTENICSARNPMQVVVFCKHVLILSKSDSNFLTLNLALYLIENEMFRSVPENKRCGQRSKVSQK